jgi:hypothetical protein
MINSRNCSQCLRRPFSLSSLFLKSQYCGLCFFVNSSLVWYSLVNPDVGGAGLHGSVVFVFMVVSAGLGRACISLQCEISGGLTRFPCSSGFTCCCDFAGEC